MRQAKEDQVVECPAILVSHSFVVARTLRRRSMDVRDARLQHWHVEVIYPPEQRLLARGMSADAGSPVELFDGAFENRESCHEVILRIEVASSSTPPLR